MFLARHSCTFSSSAREITSFFLPYGIYNQSPNCWYHRNFFFPSKVTKPEKLPVHLYEVDEEADKDEVR